MGRRGVPNPEPAQGSQRPGLRGPGAEVLRLIGHAPELLAVKAITRRAVPGPPRQVFYSLGPTGAELCALIDGWLALLPSAHPTDWRGPIGFGEAWAAGVTQALLDGPLGLPEIEMSVHLARPGVTGHQIRRLLRNERRAGRRNGVALAWAEVGRGAATRSREPRNRPDGGSQRRIRLFPHPAVGSKSDAAPCCDSDGANPVRTNRLGNETLK